VIEHKTTKTTSQPAKDFNSNGTDSTIFLKKCNKGAPHSHGARQGGALPDSKNSQICLKQPSNHEMSRQLPMQVWDLQKHKVEGEKDDESNSSKALMSVV